MTLYKRIALLLVFVLLCCGTRTTYAQSTTDDLSFEGCFSKLTSDQLFKTEGYYNWGASILKGEDGKYHLFYSRWQHNFFAWLTHSEVAHAVSDSSNGPWKYKETVLKGRGGDNWDAITAHNPKIKYFEGKYYLYYIATNAGEDSFDSEKLLNICSTGYAHPEWKTLRNNQRTGVAVSNSINGPWRRLEEPIIEPSGPITTLTVNPAIDRGGDGNYYLIVKGDKPNDPHFVRNQAVAISKTPVGPFVMQEKPVIDTFDTEDMSLWYDEGRDRFYGIFHAHTYIGLVTSEDGIEWRKATNANVYTKRIPMSDGSIIIPDRMERPFVYTEDGVGVTLCMTVKKRR